MIWSFWWMSLERLRESLRWTVDGGAKELTESTFCEELLREGLLRKLAARCQYGSSFLEREIWW